MKNTIETKSTSSKSALASDVTLRETTTTRLVFRPMIVDNTEYKNCSVKGTFFFERKKPSGQWSAMTVESLSSLKSGEGVKLELHSRELRTLFDEVSGLYEIHAEHGVPQGRKAFKITDYNSADVIDEVLQNPQAFKTLLKTGGWDLVAKLFDLFSKVENKEKLVKKLESLNDKALGDLHSAIGLHTLQSILDTWTLNQGNAVEQFWQNLFTKHPIVLEQLFSFPVTLTQECAYIGGKSVANKQGKIVDFLYKHKITNNIALIEIKNPQVQLLGSAYRGVYPLSREVSGAISQSLAYRESIMRDYTSLISELPEQERFRIAAPSCILVVGKLSQIEEDKQKVDSFERLRRDSRSVQIVTFDEVFERVARLIGFVRNPDECFVSESLDEEANAPSEAQNSDRDTRTKK